MGTIPPSSAAASEAIARIEDAQARVVKACQATDIIMQRQRERLESVRDLIEQARKSTG